MTSKASNPISGAAPRATSSWLPAGLLAVSAIYGPQLLMCLYARCFVGCSHCKTGVWQVAPIAPGLFFYEWGRRILNLPHFSSGIGLTCTIVLSLLVVAGITVLLRQAERWRVAILILVTIASGLIAVA